MENLNIQQKLLKTFRKGHQIKDIKNYYKVVKLNKKGLSRKEIKSRVNVSLDKIYRWRLTKSKPLFAQIIDDFDNRYNKRYNNKELNDIAYLIGYNLGDGNISKNFCNTWFYGVYEDLFKIRKTLLKFKVCPVVYRYKVNNGKMAVHDRIFSRFLYVFGAVRGDKTKNKVIIPRWILNSNMEVKRRFLQGLFDSELNKLTLVKRRNSYQNLKFDNSKTIDKTKEGVFFLKQIKDLLNNFGIKTSKVYLGRKYKRTRDNSNMQQLYFVIYPNYINLYNFITKIDFLYNSKRKDSSKMALKKLKLLSMKEKKKIKDYKKVIKLRTSGLSPYKIAKKLNLKDHTVKQWTYYKNKPRLYKQYSNNF
ncbi:MAG: hypothetical protein AABW56_01775 [Nanoarchaeota archaeon]